MTWRSCDCDCCRLAQAEIDTLRAALEEFSAHEYDCRVFAGDSCTCRLSAFLNHSPPPRATNP